MSKTKRRGAFKSWVLIFVLVVVWSMGGGDYIVTHWLHRPGWLFWHYWEVSAVFSTLVYLAIFYVLGYRPPKPMFRDIEPYQRAGEIAPLIVGVGICLILATGFSFYEKHCWVQLLCLSAATAAYCRMDLVVAKYSTDQKVREDFAVTYRLLDKPMLIAFLTLLTFSVISKWIGNGADDPTFRAFIGGAIAFQMIVSNWVLAIIFNKPGEPELFESTD